MGVNGLVDMIRFMCALKITQWHPRLRLETEKVVMYAKGIMVFKTRYSQEARLERQGITPRSSVRLEAHKNKANRKKKLHR